MDTTSVPACEENPHPLDSFTVEKLGEVKQGQFDWKDFPQDDLEHGWLGMGQEEGKREILTNKSHNLWANP